MKRTLTYMIKYFIIFKYSHFIARHLSVDVVDREDLMQERVIWNHG